MTAQVLATKLYIPPLRPHAVVRPRLLERLDAGLHGKLILVSAAAGFGKTTLVSEWVAHCGRREPNLRAAWLSLDEGDGDPASFLAYLVAALQTIAPGIGAGALAALESPQPPSTDALLTGLLNEIAAIPETLILVLDDYHVIDAPPVDQALAFLLEHLPPQMHLVIATREDPQLPLARLRARGQLTELRAADLRFTPAEAADFLKGAMRLDLTAEDIAALDTRTEGWIAGLQLAALALQTTPRVQAHQDASAFIRSFTGSHHFVLDYLLEEVLQRQPEGVQSFLLRTSILDRLCGPLCDAVSSPGTAALGQETLQYLERANLFIVPLDDERRWYRYHRLFAELLRQRLLQTTGALKGDHGSVDDLHRRASIWFEDNGLDDEAFQHAIAAKDYERAARIAELAWPSTFRNYIQNTLFLRWMKALPDEAIRARPVLSTGYAWALLDVGELEAADRRLRDAERWLDPQGNWIEGPEAAGMVFADREEMPSLLATIALGRAYVAVAFGDVPGTALHAQRALALLPEEDYFRRAGAVALLGVAYVRSGDLEAAANTIIEGMALVRMTEKIALSLSGVIPLADIRLAQGRLNEAVRIYERGLELATEQSEPVPEGTADMYVGLGGLAVEQGDLVAADELLRKGEELGEPAGLPGWSYRLRLHQARIKEAQGDPEAALDFFDQAERLLYRGPMPDLLPAAALRARAWARLGRLAEALEWAREAGVSIDDELSFPREFEHVTLARVLVARDKKDRGQDGIRETLSFIERLLRTAEAGGRTGSAIDILVAQALAHDAQGEIPAALVSLERALALAEPEGYARVFLEEGSPMARLLTEAAARGRMRGYAARLLAAFGAAPSRPLSSTPQPLVEPLSERELEVLRLVAQGLSNQEIGERLYLAVSTVKGHNRIIFDKLQVERRTEAVARARELGLI